MHMTKDNICFRGVSVWKVKNIKKLNSAEPMKKKRKIDPGLLIQKEAKKQRKLEKEIKKLESKGRLLKPIKEYEPSRALINTLGLDAFF